MQGSLVQDVVRQVLKQLHDPAAGMSSSREMATPADLRRDFPLLAANPNMAYLDSAATTQMPQAVVQRLIRYYGNEHAVAHRGHHRLAEGATAAYENARRTVQRFLHADDPRQIVFTAGATDAINLVASGIRLAGLSRGDQIIVSAMEHHSNFIPWMIACRQSGATLRVLGVNSQGELRLDQLPSMLNPRTRLLAVTHVSNCLGTVNPIARIARMAHDRGVPVLVDGAQHVAHAPTNVRELDCDFYAFSGHKLLAPSGIGVLYAKSRWLDALPPYRTGGGMVDDADFESVRFSAPPAKFEAGSPNVAGAVALAAAIEYIETIGWTELQRIEHSLSQYLHASLDTVPGLHRLGSRHGPLASFWLDGIDPPRIDAMLADHDIAVRSGRLCCRPLFKQLGLSGAVRASLSLYNTPRDIDRLIQVLHAIAKGRR
jgi:cysteine desulfurase/selenocysteine lyase